MRNYNRITPEGTKDLLLEECLVRRETEEKIRSVFQSQGYDELVTPGLEFFDVFQSEAVQYPQEQLYKLTDSKGRLIVLRPESTAPIARVVATRLREAMLPQRLCYMQTAYRFEPALKGRSDEFMQAGAELIGSDSYMADLEMASMAIDVLKRCNETSYYLELGDAGIFKELMRELNAAPATKEEIRYLIETKNYSALNDLLDTLGDNQLIHALKKLPSLFGGEEVFDKMEQLYCTPQIQEMLQYLRKLYREIAALIGTERLSVDLGIVNKADYYTGMILKGYLEGYGDEVLSGGRYNKLLASFGYDIPAVGFAVNVDAVAKVAMKKNPRTKKAADAAIYAAPGYEAAAIALAETKREAGLTVEFALVSSAEAALDYAKNRKISTLYQVEKEVTEVTVL